MITISEKIKNCRFVLEKLLDEQERIVYSKENEIINLNVNQFEAGLGDDGKVLKNRNPIFDGVYSLSSQLANPRKVAGNLYDFQVTGDFLRGLQIDFDSTLTKFSIFSTGTGSGDKSIFFAGYTNLFGLDNENQRILNYEIVYPDLMKFIKQYI